MKARTWFSCVDIHVSERHWCVWWIFMWHVVEHWWVYKHELMF